MKHTFIGLMIALVLFTFSVSIPTPAHAINIEISGNGPGSKNCVIVKTVNGQVVQQTTQCATASVPEFGMLPGIVAAVGSAGSLFVLRKRK
jgi:hypothetical protein